jgi:putative intracellular protease/amidase
MKKYIILLIALCSLTIAKAQKEEPKNILFFLYTGIEILDFTGPMEVFAAAGYNVYTVADRDTIISRRILKVLPDYNFNRNANFPKPDIVAVFGGGAHMQWDNKSYQDFLKSVTKDTKVDFAVCDGSFFFGGIGLLNNKKTTTYHWLTSELQKDFPKSLVLEGKRFVDDKDIVTTAGVSAGIDGAFYLVSRLKGNAFAKKIANQIEYEYWKVNMGQVETSTTLLKLQSSQFDENLVTSDTLLFKGELLNLGEFYLSKEQFKDAKQCFEYVIKHYKSNELDFDYLAKAKIALGEKSPPDHDSFIESIKAKGAEEVKTSISKTLSDFPNWKLVNQDELLYLGYYSYQNKGKYDEAIAIFELNKFLFPSHNYNDLYIAEVYVLKKESDKALTLLRKLLTTSTDKEYIENRIKELESGK